MKEKINTYTEPIIISPATPYIPKKNKFGFVEIPYVKVIILASLETEIENLKYRWECISVSSTKM